MATTTIYKLVFAGPVGAGKTTAIQSLSDIEVGATDAHASDEVQDIKPTTTVAMDYGLMRLPGGHQVRLYGTPGQKRFDFMWEILTENALGLVLLINAAAEDPVRDLRTYLAEFKTLIDQTTVVIGMSHTDRGPWDARARVNRELERLGLHPCVMDVDARRREDMTQLVKALIYTIDPFTGVGEGISPTSRLHA
jgi:signal recognition particle receptor subunit beta